MATGEHRDTPVATIALAVSEHASQHFDRLERGLKASLISLPAFQAWILEEMRQIGMAVEEFEVDPATLERQDGFRKTFRENPGALRSGPNVIGRVAGTTPGKGILLYGHADKVPDTYEWGKRFGGLVERDGRIYGPGIADDVCGITAMLSAVEVYRDLGLSPSGDLLVASVLGKQMGVFGTYGLMQRYGPVDAAIYVHPAESGLGLGELKIASLGMVEFIIEIEGKAPDSTDPHQTLFTKTAVSAAEKGVYLFQGLSRWAAETAEKYHHAGLEALAGQSFALLFGSMVAESAGRPVYEVPLRCVLRGTICFPPDETLEGMKAAFLEAYSALVAADPWLAAGHIRCQWGDLMGESFEASETSEFMQMAVAVIKDVTGKEPEFYHGHSLSDIRYPMAYWGAQAFGVGPLAGGIGTEQEWVDRKEYLDSIIAVTKMIEHAA